MFPKVLLREELIQQNTACAEQIAVAVETKEVTITFFFPFSFSLLWSISNSKEEKQILTVQVK